MNRENRVLIIGAGGHGCVVADILGCLQTSVPGLVTVGFLDEDPRKQGQEVMGLPVHGDFSRIAGVPHDSVVVAIGDNRGRQRISRQLSAAGERFFTALHPAACISRSAVLEPGCQVCAGVVVNPLARIGAGTILNTGCSVDHHSVVGPFAHVAPGARLGGNVRLGEGVFLGIGAVVIPERCVGDWTTVGAGAAVVTALPAHALCVGVPAMVKKRYDSDSQESE